MTAQPHSRVVTKEEAQPSFGLLWRFLALAAGLSTIVTLLISLSFAGYLSKLATKEITSKLSDSVLILAPIIDGAIARDDVNSARQLLRNLLDQKEVVCIDYTLPRSDETVPQHVIHLPAGGCQPITTQMKDLTSLQVRSPSNGRYEFLLAQDVIKEAQNEQIISALLVAAVAIFVTLFVLVAVLLFLVLRPLRNLQTAMLTSMPSKPALAKIYFDDEIGAVSRSYNKLAASSRIYFGRLTKFQKELSQSQVKFKDMAEISGDWFYECDRKGRFTEISDKFYERSGYEATDIIGKTLQEVAKHDKGAALWVPFETAWQAYEAFRDFECPLVTPQGPCIISLNGKPILNEAGDCVGYRGTGRDVTEIANDRRLLEETNRNFGDSVSYASQIQRSLLVRADALKEQLGQVASVWQPKDLVGGDFYWIGKIGQARYLVFFDCTGHGVPGAFMTLITASVLEKIISASPLPLSAPVMLEQIHRGVCTQLGIVYGSDGKDGLDCAVLKINQSEGSAEFAGAGLDLFHVDAAQTVTRIRGTRATLGYRIYETAREFEAHQILIDGASFVLMTDGLATQVGEETKRVLGTRRIIEALEQAKSHKPAALIRALGSLLKIWQGSEERRDDVTILAFNLLSEDDAR